MRRLLFAFLLLSLSARADEKAILRRWNDAVGGAENITRIKAVHAIWDLDEDGMAGTREEWDTVTLKRREVVDHVHDTSTVVFDGKNGWRRDWNGFVERLAGDDLRRQSDVALVHTMAALSGAAGAATPVGTDTLEFHAANGSKVRYVFDPASGLPLRAEMPSFDGILTIAFSDWRKAGGILVPFTETWTTGPNKTTARLRSIEVVAENGVDLTPPQPGPEDAFFLRPGRKSETLPFNFDNNHIMVLTTVNGVGPIWFLVDTGAGYSIINKSRLSEFNLPTYGGMTTIGGGSAAASGAFVEHVTYRLGEVELRDQHATVLELRGLEKIYGMQVGGILGFDFLSRFVVDVDYVAKTMTLHPRTWESSDQRGTVVPLVIQGEQPYCAGRISVRGESIPAWFILDVGAADTITFTTPFITAHDLLERAGDERRHIVKYAAPDVEAFNPTNVRGLIDSVTLGDYVLPHVLVNLSAAKTGAYTSPAFDGNIGETLLSRFSHMILDYRRSVMILRAGPQTFRPFEERKGFGLTVVAGSPELHHFTVSAVGEKSGAAAAGFAKGDVITSVDGTPASQLNIAMLKKILAQDGSRHTFGVERGPQQLMLDATIVLTPVSSLK